MGSIAGGKYSARTVLVQKIKLLHISDLHISRFPRIRGILDQIKGLTQGNFFDLSSRLVLASTYCPNKLRAVVDLVFKIDRFSGPIDALIVTGDIATTGLHADQTKALEFFEGPPSPHHSRATMKGFPTLAKTGVQLILLPGNHDRYQVGQAWGYDPGSREFDRVFYKYWAGIVQTTVLSNDECDFEVGIVSADLTLDGIHDSNAGWLPYKKLYSYAQGRVRETTLKIMKEKTSDLFDEIFARGRDPIIIWAVHYPPQFVDIGDAHLLINEDDLVNEADELGISAILCGHTHKHRNYRTPKGGIIFCNGTTTQHFAPHGNYCELIEFERTDTGEVALNLTIYQYDKFYGSFV